MQLSCHLKEQLRRIHRRTSCLPQSFLSSPAVSNRMGDLSWAIRTTRTVRDRNWHTIYNDIHRYTSTSPALFLASTLRGPSFRPVPSLLLASLTEAKRKTLFQFLTMEERIDQPDNYKGPLYEHPSHQQWDNYMTLCSDDGYKVLTFDWTCGDKFQSMF